MLSSALWFVYLEGIDHLGRFKARREVAACVCGVDIAVSRSDVATTYVLEIHRRPRI